ncbi:polyprenol reductase-like [Eupeodes corollae]|uniref:polyprenol reductase-like n=1 Tax=Eupeodes corollae TaxID=290404 RepID=UPI00249376D2|nr:polyprenol reductase-like [Eupeodes corollae]
MDNEWNEDDDNDNDNDDGRQKANGLKTSTKINLSHNIVGYFHYFGCITAALTNTEGFVRGLLFTTLCRKFIWVKDILSFQEQHHRHSQSRKSPSCSKFAASSSSSAGHSNTRKSSLEYLFLTLFVSFGNAWLTHKWYRENLKNYPKRRNSIYPYIP